MHLAPLASLGPLSSLSRARRALLAVGLTALVGAVVLDPAPGLGWGSATGGAGLSKKEREDLLWLFDHYGLAPKIDAAELDRRTGAHPIHQFIVYQAWLLLKDDPATQDGQSGFPTLAEINGWDGIDRCDRGMRQRGSPGLAAALPELAPSESDGPGADAELTPAGADGGLAWNPLYSARAHYWNPWLESGDAPTAAGANLSRLSAANIRNSVQRAHYAAYLAHYIADPLSPKHADVVGLTPTEAEQLTGIAKAWAAAFKDNDDLDAWLASPLLDRAVQRLEAKIAGLPQGSAWRARVERHVPFIGGTTLLQRENHWWWKVDVRPSTFRTSVACFLAALAAKPDDKSADAFFGFFDPFYYNGPIYDALGSYPSFALCTPLSEHLFWETNPAQGELARTTIAAQEAKPVAERTPMLTGGARAQYFGWKASPAMVGPSAADTFAAWRDAGAELVRQCSRTVHGDVDQDSDFATSPDAALQTAIRCVFTAYRATITALRVEAWGRPVSDPAAGPGGAGGDEVMAHLQLHVTNLADRPARLTVARVLVWDPKKNGWAKTRPEWTVDLKDASVAPGGKDATDVGILVRGIPKGLPMEYLEVDVHGEVADTPDRGWVRVGVSEVGVDMVHSPSAETTLTSSKGPVDIVVAFDTTASMQSSIDSLRANAIASIRKLQAQTDDLRLAVVTFRDLAEEADRPHFVVRPFTRDVASQFAFLNGLAADGGGDTPEDQLHAVSLGLGLWESEAAEGGVGDRVPSKIIVIVTDAPAKDPDSMGNTADSIGARAAAVDPAHIYPIVVRDDAAALATAEGLARRTGGKVLHAASGDEVANVLGQAIGAAVVAHAGESSRGGGAARWLLIGLGAAMVAVGLVLGGLALRARRRAREVSHA